MRTVLTSLLNEPSSELKSRDDREKAKVLSSLLFAYWFSSVVFLILIYIFPLFSAVPENARRGLLETFLVQGAAYIISRTRFYQVSCVMVTLGQTLGTVEGIWKDPHYTTVLAASPWLTANILVCCLVLSPKQTSLIMAACLMIYGSIFWVLPPQEREFGVWGALFFLFTSSLAVLSGWLRDRVEGQVREAFQVLHEREGYLSALLSGIPDSIFQLDNAGRVLNYHTHQLGALILPPENFLGKRIIDVLPPEQVKTFSDSFDRFLRTMESQHFDYSFSSPNGIRYFEGSLTLGKNDCKLLIVRETTERVRAQLLVEEQRMKLVTSSKLSSLGEMAGGIAHEINNPLSVILGRTQYLEAQTTQNKPIDVNEILKFTQTTSKMVERIGKIIKGLRAFARDGEHDPMARKSLRQVLDEVLPFCETRFQNHGIQLEVAKNLSDLTVNCRSVQLSQVFLNLLNNAHDANFNIVKKPWIKIEAKKVNTGVEVSVTDSGSGIPEPLRDRIFQPFFTTKEVGKGTGLGLSVSKGIIESHGGRLRYDGESPNTRFVIWLPE